MSDAKAKLLNASSVAVPVRYGLIGLVLVLLPVMLPGYRLFQVSIAGVWCLAIMYMNLIGGYAGQLSVAASVYFGIGAYGTAILSKDHDLSLIASVLISMGLAAMLGALIGVLTAKLSGLYMTKASLVFAILFPRLMSHNADVTGGDAGFVLGSVAAPSWARMNNDAWRYTLIAVCLAVSALLVKRLVVSSVGRALLAIRHGEHVARAFGVDPTRLKFTLGVVVGAGVALAGALYVLTVGIVSPGSVEVFLGINLILAMVVGGGATLWGPVIGAVFLQFGPVLSSDVGERWGGALFGVVVILVVILAPDGVAGTARNLVRRVREYRSAQRLGPPPAAMTSEAATATMVQAAARSGT